MVMVYTGAAVLVMRTEVVHGVQGWRRGEDKEDEDIEESTA